MSIFCKPSLRSTNIPVAPGIVEIPTLGTKVCKQDPLWAIWSPQVSHSRETCNPQSTSMEEAWIVQIGGYMDNSQDTYRSNGARPWSMTKGIDKLPCPCIYTYVSAYLCVYIYVYAYPHIYIAIRRCMYT